MLNGLLEPLPVKYYSQRDSETGHSMRMCYSSCCAMLLNYLKPGILKGENGDDQYLYRVLRYGDTTNASAQISALKSFGITAYFSKDLDWDDVDGQLAKDIPVPIGILHLGHVSNPINQGGHWIEVIGKTRNGLGYFIHDPFGELDLINGGYISNYGNKLVYSKENLEKRWMVGGERGWGIIASNPNQTKKEQEKKPVQTDNKKHWAWPLADELNKAGVLMNTGNLDKPLTKGEVLALIAASVTKSKEIESAANKARSRKQ